MTTTREPGHDRVRPTVDADDVANTGRATAAMKAAGRPALKSEHRATRKPVGSTVQRPETSITQRLIQRPPAARDRCSTERTGYHLHVRRSKIAGCPPLPTVRVRSRVH